MNPELPFTEQVMADMATLAGVTLTPDLYAAAVDYVGVFQFILHS
jgi:hypothetical protein